MAPGRRGEVTAMDQQRLREWLLAHVAAAAGLPAGQIRTDQPFSDLGLDSVRLAALAGDLEEALGRTVDPTVLFEHPTIEELAAAVAAQPASRSRAAAPRRPPAGPGGEPVAIVGMACRFPGAPDLEGLWRLLLDGVDAVVEVPPERWQAEQVYDADPGVPGRAYSKWGGFIDEVDQFDRGFFRISADEALRMDPQQRLLLEVCWEALEDAGEVPARLRGSRTGVYVGISLSEYASRQLADPQRIGPYTPTGNALSVAANRLSYQFDFQGPSVAVDTACSSSLVATHLACRALRAGDCDRAVVAGVNLLLDPELTIGLCKAGMLAPDGRCRPFDERATGYVRGEGCAVALLKPLAAALADGDRVYAVIRGSAVNSDGSSNGLTAPNPAAQRAVLEAAYRDADVVPAAVHYVECHGTGTFLGDPIEARALGAVIGVGRPPGAPALIGSVKSNLGHLEAAAGIAGLLKVALALHHRQLPPSLHFTRPNPHIPFAELGLAVVTQARPWPSPSSGGPWLAGVSSFGFGGSNAHVMLESAPQAAPAPAPDGPVVLPVSARSRAGLERLLGAWAKRLRTATPDEAAALAWTASVRRTHHRPFRVAVVAGEAAVLGERVREAATAGVPPGEPSRGAVSGAPRVAFVFPGQGSQWPGMARGLLDSDSLFASTIRRCDELLAGELDWSVEALLRGEDQQRDLADTAVAQPVIVAVQLALAAVWRALGIEPAALVGHSIGEVSAAIVAGHLEIEEGLRLAARRGRLMALPGGEGRMLATGLSREEAEDLVARDPEVLALAAANAPRATVLAGDPDALAAVLAELRGRGVFARWLPVGYAFHSPRMRAAAEALTSSLGTLTRGRPSLPLHSAVLGRRVEARELDACYWGRNVRDPVDFAAAVGALLADGADALLEVGPRAELRAPLRQLAEQQDSPRPAVLTTLDRGRDDRRSLLEAACQLYTLGCPVRWAYLWPQGGRVRSLPRHPWDHERFWLPRVEPRAAAGPAGHALLGGRVDLAASDGPLVWEATLDLASAPWLADHRVGGAVLLPASAYVELALAAARGAGFQEPVAVEGLTLHRALPLERGPVVVQTTLSAADGDVRTLRVHSRSASTVDGSWTLHASGRLRPAPRERPAAPDLAGAAVRCLEQLPAPLFYQLLAAQGLGYGPAFRGVQEVWRGDGEALGIVDAPRGGGPEGVALLDAALQLVGAAAGLAPGVEAGGGPFVPSAIGAVRRWPAPASPTRAHVRTTSAGDGQVRADLVLLDPEGLPCLEVEGLELRRLGSPPRPAAGQAAAATLHLYEPRWRERPLPPAAASDRPRQGRWLVLTDQGGLGHRLLQELEALGLDVAACVPGAAFGRTSTGELRVDPADPEHYQRLVDQVAGGGPLAGVVHLWALDPPPRGLGVGWFAFPAACVLHLIRALSFAVGGAVPRLLVATRGCQPGPDGGVADPLPATLWGLLKSVPIENPLLQLCCVDLDPATTDPGGAAAQLLAELAAERPEAEVVWRGARRFVRRLAALDECPASAGGMPVHADATYVITGGTGGLGLLVAGRLVERGARHLALLARHADPPVARPAIAALRRAGAGVTVVAVDAGDREALAEALAAMRASGPPLRGVVHAAGVIQDVALLDMPVGALEAVLAPKVLGGWNLHELTVGDPLDWLVLFSSAAGVLGSPGQANYAAANAYLDALAHHRRARGLPATSIDWGPWAEVGMAAGTAETSEGRRLRTAVSAIAPGEGLDMLERLLGSERAAAVVLPFDLRDLLQFYPAGAGTAFFEEIAGAEVRALKSTVMASSARPDLPSRYLAPRNGLERRIVAIWQKSLGIEPVGVLDSFFELGGDSVFGNQILVEINRALGVTIDPERAFQDLTVAHLATLAEEQMVVRLRQMSEEEAARLLAEREG
jgi:acyl transferase domain-containing protein/acyl carrier protein/NAD(P)-dependent dehydrogenase (short-subunit alcohol dehydrogenase family)